MATSFGFDGVGEDSSVGGDRGVLGQRGQKVEVGDGGIEPTGRS
jgi:hypothetical protein